MTGKSLGIVLEHNVDIKIPCAQFDKCVQNFGDKRLVYMTNSDGKFRAELKADLDDEDYILRISGWQKEDILEIRRIYAREDKTLDLEPHVFDFLDLLEDWAVECRGSLYFAYVDFEEPLVDVCWIAKGQIKEDQTFKNKKIRDVLEEYGYDDPTFL